MLVEHIKKGRGMILMGKDGMNYAPKGKPNRVVEDGEFVIAAIALDHGHVYGMCNGLIEARWRVCNCGDRA